MDAFRYSLALIFLLVLPPMLMFWIVVHPFIHFWRRLGLRRTYGLLVGGMMLGVCVLFLIRKPLLAVDFGTSVPLMIAGTVCLAFSVLLRVMVGKRISTGQIVGVPEIAPETHPGELLTTGIYSRIRHPRYAQVLLGLAAGAFMANNLGSYVAAALWLPGLWIIVRLEERELCERFAEYEDYRRRVPAFFPGLKG